jgi:hypothetical protein
MLKSTQMIQSRIADDAAANGPVIASCGLLCEALCGSQ